ncbi:hypothetical protein [Streptomyces sp. SID1121]|uniref:hypothetical protein n=1 Tax=Streptomyces sp. SID1121 TaxID=3425888 RepID=UPI004056D552
MVSDLLHEPPEPAVRLPEPAREPVLITRTDPLNQRAVAARAVSTDAARARSTTGRQQVAKADPPPRPVRLSAAQLQRLEDMSKERERANIPSWDRRPYGAVSDRPLDERLAESIDLARQQDRAATEATEQARLLSERLVEEKAGGQSYVAEMVEVLDQADRHVAAARTYADTEAAAAGSTREAAEHLAHLAAADGKGRIALRLAGTSQKEHTRLTQEAKTRRAAAWTVESEARIAGNRKREAAWQTVRDSPALGSSQHTPAAELDVLADGLAAMRRDLPAQGQARDARDLQEPARLHGQAVSARTEATS